MLFCWRKYGRLFSKIFMMVRSTALRLAARKGKIISPDEGMMTPRPADFIPGSTGVKLMLRFTGSPSRSPRVLRREPSTVSSTTPLTFSPGITRSLLASALMVMGNDGSAVTIPSGSPAASRRSEKKISMLLLSPALIFTSVTVKTPSAGIVTAISPLDFIPYAFPFQVTVSSLFSFALRIFSTEKLWTFPPEWSQTMDSLRFPTLTVRYFSTSALSIWSEVTRVPVRV